MAGSSPARIVRSGRRQVRRALDVATNPLRRSVLAQRRRDHAGPRVLAISVPKAGTHLLAGCLEAFPDLRCFHRGVRFLPLARHEAARAADRAFGAMGGGMFASTHVAWSSELEGALAAMGVQTLLLVRDPRDVVVSFVQFAMTRRRHPQHRLFASLADDEARIRTAIEGSRALGEPPRVLERFERMLPWAKHGAALVRFERLVGPRGGGGEAEQLDEIAGIARHLGLELSPEQTRAVARRAFDPASPTFRSGRAGDWRRRFTSGHAALFDRLAGPLLDELGYPRADGGA